MKIRCLTFGVLGCNNYIVAREGAKEGVLIDCSGRGNGILQAIREEGIEIKAILLTHGHIDHIEAVDRVAKEFNCPVYLHRLDRDFFHRSDYNWSERLYMEALTVDTEPCLLEGNEILEIAGISIEVLHTPGHTNGSVCYLTDDAVFTGDTLFYESIGADLPPFGNTKTEIQSVQEVLFALNDQLRCYPGHSVLTSIGHERKNNLYCKL